MPAFCFLNTVSLASDQTSVAKQISPANGTYSFQVTTRLAAGGAVVSGPTGIHVSNRQFTFIRVRWDLATTTVFVDGSNTKLTDDWTTIGSLAVVVGLATVLHVTLG